MPRTIAIVLLCIMLIGCRQDMHSMPGDHAKTFLALGDSYTIGESVGANDCWPMQLVARLRNEHIQIADPTIIAKTGWTTDELSAVIDAAKINGQRFDLVTLLIGVNNQYRGRSINEYRSQFISLLNRAVEFAGGNAEHVVVVSIPDWGVTPFAHDRDHAKIAAEIDAFNQINRQEAKQMGARYVDVTRLSRSSSELLAHDGLHPSAEMYSLWTSEIFPEAHLALSN